MQFAGALLRERLARLIVGRYRRLLIATAITLAISLSLLGLIGLVKWRAHQAIQSDTEALVDQTGQQLLGRLRSRRGTLTFLRDTLNREPTLTDSQLEALGASAVQHTRHLLGTGLVRSGDNPTWWAKPRGFSSAEEVHLNRALLQRTKVPGIWTVPSTFTTSPSPQRLLLIMMEPLRAAPYRKSAIAGVFDFKPLLADFFTSDLSDRHPVQLLDDQTTLYRSPAWKEPSTAPSVQTEKRPSAVTVELPLAIDAERWTIQMQPARTRLVQTLSWFNILLIALSLAAGIGALSLVWILAARTWILQRAVARRTSALRRASKRLRQLAITDELTGLYNRRFFLSRWKWECERAKRYHRPLACLMIDVNGFKGVNDRLGHHAGDLILRQVAQELKTLLRQSDLLARFGGDEFVIALPETDPEKAMAVAEKLRQIRIRFPEADIKGLPPVSLSVGISRIEESLENPQDLLEAADQSLYSDKRHQQVLRASPHSTRSSPRMIRKETSRPDKTL